MRVSSSPFAITQEGWGVFCLFAKVFFKPGTGLSPVKLAHHLRFDQEQSLTPFSIYPDKEQFLKHLEKL